MSSYQEMDNQQKQKEVRRVSEMFKKLTDAKNKDFYLKIMPLLDDYKRKELLIKIDAKGNRECVGIQFHCTSLGMDEHIGYIRSLLHGKGFKVEGNKNSETITIK